VASYRWGNLLVNAIDLNGALDIDGGITTMTHDPGTSIPVLKIENTRSSTTPRGIHIDFTASVAGFFMYCENSNALQFTMSAYDGTCLNGSGTYDTISDKFLKENIVDCTPKLDDLMKCKVRNFNLIGNDEKHIGVISQELESIFPGLVYEAGKWRGRENAKAVKYSVFVPMLIKAIQELNEKVDKLKDK